jgi:hypothetical protein
MWERSKPQPAPTAPSAPATPVAPAAPVQSPNERTIMEITLKDLMYRLNDITADHPFEGNVDEGHENELDCECDLCIAHRVLLALWSDMKGENNAKLGI